MQRLLRPFQVRDRYAQRTDAYALRVCRIIDACTLQNSIRFGTRGKHLPA